jgi:hypothetical protein
MTPALKQEVALVKAGQACRLLEEALNEAPNRRHVFHRLQSLLSKYSVEITPADADAQ